MLSKTKQQETKTVCPFIFFYRLALRQSSTETC